MDFFFLCGDEYMIILLLIYSDLFYAINAASIDWNKCFILAFIILTSIPEWINQDWPFVNSSSHLKQESGLLLYNSGA